MLKICVSSTYYGTYDEPVSKRTRGGSSSDEFLFCHLLFTHYLLHLPVTNDAILVGILR